MSDKNTLRVWTFFRQGIRIQGRMNLRRRLWLLLKRICVPAHRMRQLRLMTAWKH